MFGVMMEFGLEAGTGSPNVSPLLQVSLPPWMLVTHIGCWFPTLALDVSSPNWLLGPHIGI